MDGHENQLAVIIEHLEKEILACSGTDLDDTVVPYALDRAIRSLRLRGTSFIDWIPFIHIGH